jgi:hypothetical protein
VIKLKSFEGNFSGSGILQFTENIFAGAVKILLVTLAVFGRVSSMQLMARRKAIPHTGYEGTVFLPFSSRDCPYVAA